MKEIKRAKPFDKQTPPQSTLSERSKDSVQTFTKAPFIRKRDKEPNLFDKVADMKATIDIEKIVSHAKTAAEQYLKSKVPMNDTIAKTASEHGYNSDQIQRIVETANMITYQYLYKKASEDKNVVFDIANADTISNILLTKRETMEKAAFSKDEEKLIPSDYIRPPGWSSPVEKVAEEVSHPETTDSLVRKEMAKYANIRRDHEELPRLVELIKSAMVQGSSFEKSQGNCDKFLMIMKIAQTTGTSRDAIIKVAAQLKRHGYLGEEDLLKVASAIENPDLLPNLPPDRVVNGDSLLIRTLKIFKEGDWNAQIDVRTDKSIESK